MRIPCSIPWFTDIRHLIGLTEISCIRTVQSEWVGLLCSTLLRCAENRHRSPLRADRLFNAAFEWVASLHLEVWVACWWLNIGSRCIGHLRLGTKRSLYACEENRGGCSLTTSLRERICDMRHSASKLLVRGIDPRFDSRCTAIIFDFSRAPRFPPQPITHTQLSASRLNIFVVQQHRVHRHGDPLLHENHGP